MYVINVTYSEGSVGLFMSTSGYWQLISKNHTKCKGHQIHTRHMQMYFVLFIKRAFTHWFTRVKYSPPPAPLENLLSVFMIAILYVFIPHTIV